MAQIRRRRHGWIAQLAVGFVLAVTLPLPAAHPVAAITTVASVPMDCPLFTPSDMAVLGVDTIVVGWALDESDPVGDVQVCRIELDGDAGWTKTIPNVYRSEPIAVAVGAGGIYVAGTSQEETTLTTSGWVKRFGLDGVAKQSVSIASGLDETLADIAAGPDGKIYVTGRTEGILGDHPPLPRVPTQADAFVRAFEPDLDVLWTDQFRGMVSHQYDTTLRDGFAWGVAIAADATGVYLTGDVIGSLPGGPAMRHVDDAFVRHYSSAGTVLWTRQFDATWPDAEDDFHSELQSHSADIAISAQGVHVVGVSQGLGDRSYERRYDLFERVYRTDGSVVWTKEIGGWADDTARKVFPDAAGSVVLGVAPEGLVDPGGEGVYFLARFGTTGAVESTMTFAPTGWLIQGSAAIGDGSAVRFGAIVVPDPYAVNPSPDVIPPPGTNLLRFDAIPPLISTPSVRPTSRSTVSSTSIPLDISWTAADGASAIATAEVQVSRNGGAWSAVPVPSASTRVVTSSGSPGGTVRARVRSTDAAGNVSGWSYSPTVKLKLVQETSSSIIESASWRRVAQASALGGYVDKTAGYGAFARYRFTGRGIAWVATLGPARGRADVYIDGKFASRIDMYSTAFAGRRIVFQRTWSSPGSHTIEIRNRATSGRPRIDIDALIVSQ